MLLLNEVSGDEPGYFDSAVIRVRAIAKGNEEFIHRELRFIPFYVHRTPPNTSFLMTFGVFSIP